MKNAAWVGLILIFIIYAVFFKPSNNINTKNNLHAPQKEANQLSDSALNQQSNKGISKKQVNDQSSPANIITEEKKKQQTKKVLNRFVKETGMIIPKLNNIQFRQVDIDNDNLTIIYGKVPNVSRSVTVIATRGVVTAKKALEFLKEEGNIIPNFGNKGLPLAKKVYTVPTQPGKGFTSTNSIFIGKPNRLGITTNGILLTRKDGKGTYLYLLKTHKDFFDKNEGAMDNLYNEIKLVDQK